MKQRRRKIRGLILALATAAVFAPAAHGHVYFSGSSEQSSSGLTPQALKAMGDRWNALAQSYETTRPDDRVGTHGVGSTTLSDVVDRAVANIQASSSKAMHADDRGGIRGTGPIETPTVIARYDRGFDWEDAGIGASIALLTAVMLGAAALTRRRTGLAV